MFLSNRYVFKRLGQVTGLILSLWTGVTQASLEEGLSLMNQGLFKQAFVVFDVEADKGNVRALFWKARMMEMLGGTEAMSAGEVYLEAAQLGDPWAMYQLYPQGMNGCSFYGWSACDESWQKKAVEGWEQLAAKGDGNAYYALTFYSGGLWQRIPFYNSYKTDLLLDKGLDNGCNACAYIIGLSEKENGIQALEVAANRGYAPAMLQLYFMLKELHPEKAITWATKAAKLGYADAAFNLSFAFLKGDQGITQSNENAYLFGKIAALLGHSSYKDMLDNPGFSTEVQAVNPKDRPALDKRAEEFMKGVTKNLFIDETETGFITR